MSLPLMIIIFSLRNSHIFSNPDLQGALGICFGVVFFLSLCSPLLVGVEWIFLNQLKQISKICFDIKNGHYTYFSLPNEPSESGEENEMVSLMRDMNWMIRQIEYRETELETRVIERTQALEKTNIKLGEATEEAKSSSKSKSQFLATMSHEIRTPMNAIIGMSDLVLKTKLDFRQKEFLNIIHTSSKSLLKIMNDILDFSKIDAGKLSIEKIPVNLRTLFEEITDMFKYDMSDNRIEFILDIDENVPVQILSDPLRLRQVFINLVSNAMKFTQKGEIVLQVSPEKQFQNDPKLVFSVKDTGIGMDRPTQKKIFSAFSQADGSISRKFGGTGLGLAISKKLINLMGSDIQVESEKGKGSCFKFVLDVENCKSIPPLLYRSHKSVPQLLKTKTVLLAIKNKTTCKTLQKFLKSFGLKQFSVFSWPEAVAAAEKAKGKDTFSLAIIDLDLPNLSTDGHSALLSSGKIPVLTIGSLRGGTEPFVPDWAQKFISKPVKQSILFDTILEIFNYQISSESKASDCLDIFSDTEKTRILLVEDNSINQRIAIEILKTAGIHPVIADGGRQAIDHINAQTFDAVLMDIQMPGMDGYEVVKKIRQLPSGKHLPIIAMTANALEKDRKKGITAGMDGYVTKPVEATLLFETLANVLKKEGAFNRKSQKTSDTNDCILQDLPGIDSVKLLGRINGSQSLSEELIIDFKNKKSNIKNTLSTDIINRIETMGQLIKQNSLKAKAFSKELTLSLQSTPFIEDAHTLESQIKRFDFKSAQMTFQNFRTKIQPYLAVDSLEKKLK